MVRDRPFGRFMIRKLAVPFDGEAQRGSMTSRTNRIGEDD